MKDSTFLDWIVGHSKTFFSTDSYPCWPLHDSTSLVIWWAFFLKFSNFKFSFLFSNYDLNNFFRLLPSSVANNIWTPPIPRETTRSVQICMPMMRSGFLVRLTPLVAQWVDIEALKNKNHTSLSYFFDSLSAIRQISSFESALNRVVTHQHALRAWSFQLSCLPIEP